MNGDVATATSLAYFNHKLPLPPSSLLNARCSNSLSVLNIEMTRVSQAFLSAYLFLFIVLSFFKSL